MFILHLFRGVCPSSQEIGNKLGLALCTAVCPFIALREFDIIFGQNIRSNIKG